LPKYLENAKRLAEYRVRAAQIAIEMKEQSQYHHNSRRLERTPSRSHSRSASGSPELICLDDTENEDSPEKPTETPPRCNNTQTGLIQQVVSKSPPTFSMQLEIETEATPAENGSVLDEFLTLKPAVAAEPIIEEAAVCNDVKEQQPQQLDLTVLSSYSKIVEIIQPKAGLEMPVEEATLKRRRSITPPPAEPNIDKRTKTMPTEELDDDIIELTPSDMSMTAKQLSAPPRPQQQAQQPQQQQQQQPPQPPLVATPHKSRIMETALAASLLQAEATNAPILKLGSPYSLTSPMEYYSQAKETTKQRNQKIWLPYRIAWRHPHHQWNPWRLSIPM